MGQHVHVPHATASLRGLIRFCNRRASPRADKIEFGSLADQRPTGTHRIAPLIAELSQKIHKNHLS